MLFKQIISISTFQFIEKILLLMIIPIIVNKLSIIDYGIYNQVIITVSFLFIFMHLYMHEYLNNFFTGKKKEEIYQSFSNFFLIITISFLFFFSTLVLFFIFDIKIFYGIESLKVFISIILFSYAEAIIRLISAYYRSLMKIIFSNFLIIIFSIIKILIILLFIFIYAEISEPIFYASLFMISLCLGLVLIIFKDNNFNLKLILFSKKNLNNYLSYCLPLIFLAAILWLNNFGDRYLLIYLEDYTFFSNYSIVYSLSVIGYFIPSVLNLVFHPQMQKDKNLNQSKNFHKIFSKFLHISNSLFILLFFFLFFFDELLIKLIFLNNFNYTFLLDYFFYMTFGLYIYGLFESTYIYYFINNKNFLLFKLSSFITIFYFLVLLFSYYNFNKIYIVEFFLVMKLLTIIISFYICNFIFEKIIYLFLQILIILFLFLFKIIELNYFSIFFVFIIYLFLLYKNRRYLIKTNLI